MKTIDQPNKASSHTNIKFIDEYSEIAQLVDGIESAKKSGVPVIEVVCPIRRGYMGRFLDRIYERHTKLSSETPWLFAICQDEDAAIDLALFSKKHKEIPILAAISENDLTPRVLRYIKAK